MDPHTAVGDRHSAAMVPKEVTGGIVLAAILLYAGPASATDTVTSATLNVFEKRQDKKLRDALDNPLLRK
jgi:hypothetical protein